MALAAIQPEWPLGRPGSRTRSQASSRPPLASTGRTVRTRVSGRRAATASTRRAVALRRGAGRRGRRARRPAPAERGAAPARSRGGKRRGREADRRAPAEPAAGRRERSSGELRGAAGRAAAPGRERGSGTSTVFGVVESSKVTWATTRWAAGGRRDGHVARRRRSRFSTRLPLTVNVTFLIRWCRARWRARRPGPTLPRPRLAVPSPLALPLPLPLGPVLTGRCLWSVVPAPRPAGSGPSRSRSCRGVSTSLIRLTSPLRASSASQDRDAVVERDRGQGHHVARERGAGPERRRAADFQ